MTEPNPTQSKREVSDLRPGDEIEMYVIASNEGWDWTPATVVETAPLRVRWWDGEEKAWTREGARIPRIRVRPEPVSPSDNDHDEIERLKRELEDAIEDEKDAASRASALIEELADLGVNVADLDTRP